MMAMPVSPEAYLDFGHSLRAQREKKGLSVDDVAKVTKIPPTLIGALEDGQAERFPETVFVVNYVRSYARAVGLEPDATVARYQQIPGVPAPEAFDPATLEKARREQALTRAWLVAAGASAASFAAWLAWASDVALRFTAR
jgi:cytoskeletal protein RodZ